MSIREFEEEIILNPLITSNTKVLINALKNKIAELSISMGYEDSCWDHHKFVDEYFESVTGISTGETK